MNKSDSVMQLGVTAAKYETSCSQVIMSVVALSMYFFLFITIPWSSVHAQYREGFLNSLTQAQLLDELSVRVYWGETNLVREVLARAVDVNAVPSGEKGSFAEPVLITAMKGMKPENIPTIVNLLLEKRVNVNSKDRFNNTAFTELVYQTSDEMKHMRPPTLPKYLALVIPKLFQAGADPSIKNDFGHSAVSLANEGDVPEEIKRLVLKK